MPSNSNVANTLTNQRKSRYQGTHKLFLQENNIRELGNDGVTYSANSIMMRKERFNLPHISKNSSDNNLSFSSISSVEDKKESEEFYQSFLANLREENTKSKSQAKQSELRKRRKQTEKVSRSPMLRVHPRQTSTNKKGSVSIASVITKKFFKKPPEVVCATPCKKKTKGSTNVISVLPCSLCPQKIDVNDLNSQSHTPKNNIYNSPTKEKTSDIKQIKKTDSKTELIFKKNKKSKFFICCIPFKL